MLFIYPSLNEILDCLIETHKEAFKPHIISVLKENFKELLS